MPSASSLFFCSNTIGKVPIVLRVLSPNVAQKRMQFRDIFILFIAFFLRFLFHSFSLFNSRDMSCNDSKIRGSDCQPVSVRELKYFPSLRSGMSLYLQKRLSARGTWAQDMRSEHKVVSYRKSLVQRFESILVLI